MIILKTMDICEECPNFDAEVRDFLITQLKNLEDLYNFEGLEDNTDGE